MNSRQTTTKRNTIQKALVLGAVKQLQCHATADEIYQAVSAQHPNISRATVYRNLNQLSESGEIRRLEIPGGADRFDHLCHNHYHARCLSCGRIFDLDMDCLEDLEQKITNTFGFEIRGHDLMFNGICPECNNTIGSDS